MKKRLLSILSIFACFCALFIFQAAPVSHASSYEYTAEEFSQYTNQWIELWLAGDMSALDEFNQQYISYGMNVNYDITEEAYTEAVAKVGEFSEYGEATCTTDGDVVTVKQPVACTGKDVEFTFSWNMTSNEITWAVDLENSIGEAVAKAGLNTVLGVGTVFVVLIFISFVISLFVLFSRDKKKKAEADAAVAVQEEAVTAADVYEASDDEEIAAVIAAAIAAYEADSENYEVPADGLFVRSIKKRGMN